jgi:fermentation-respiration switch protein FrsA (DUF1100 family)
VGAIKWLLASLLVGYVLALVGLAVFQRKLLYFPDKRLADPAQAGLSGLEELRLSTPDGQTLVAWHVAAKEGRPLILYFHGNGGALVDRLPRFRLFAASGYGLLAVSFRGYGGSTGEPTQEGLLSDGEAAYKEAQRRGYGPDRIVMIGESLGTGVATALAATHDAAALVLDSPYLSAIDVAASHYPIFPVRYVMLDPFRSDLSIDKVKIPVLMVHGEGDQVVPISSGRALFERANQPKAFVGVPGGGHLVLGLPQVFPRVREWIDERVTRRAANRESRPAR